jgi:hypothetical protein
MGATVVSRPTHLRSVGSFWECALSLGWPTHRGGLSDPHSFELSSIAGNSMLIRVAHRIADLRKLDSFGARMWR